jgi:DNA ligase (NAD+)
MDIEGLGEKVARKLVETDLVESLDDLYRLEVEDLVELEGFAEKSAQNLVDAIEASTDRSLARLLYALGIRHVGRTVAETIVEHYASMEAIAEADAEELADIDGVGPVIAESVADWFAVDRNRELVEALADLGVNVERLPEEAPAEGPRPLDGLTFVLTGSLPERTRSEAADAIERAGGSVTSSVSGNTDVLVVGANPGSKLDAAQEEGAAIMRIERPEDFESLLDGGLPVAS